MHIACRPISERVSLISDKNCQLLAVEPTILVSPGAGFVSHSVDYENFCQLSSSAPSHQFTHTVPKMKNAAQSRLGGICEGLALL